MAHKFFQAKRPWSKYKDFILNYYLDPYIPKVAKLGKPILIVDCFAGCGTFGDSEPGSPLIISALVKKWQEQGVNVRAEFIEADPENFQSLQQAVLPYQEFVTARHGSFESHLPVLAARAKQNTVFLYVDPYTVKGLVFDRMKEVYDQIRQASASVELLLNFNVVTFMRWGLAAVKRQSEFPLELGAEADALADDPAESVEMATLDSIAGGVYWREIAQDSLATFQDKLDQFINRYLDELAEPFSFAASYEVKDKYEHRVPKYVLIYGTRHPDGIELMNDAMCKARQQFLGTRFKKNALFDDTPEEELPDTGQLKRDLLEILGNGRTLTRKQLRGHAILNHFCRFQAKDINASIGELLKAGRLHSNTGKSRINDEVLLNASRFDSSTVKSGNPARHTGS
ncbi:MAG: three-Cys-motif partner protein TcmP [Planctomycetes bacterium]|nr:three-Cys-motif partner protein TcmP [Planctomycetota bacterium]